MKIAHKLSWDLGKFYNNENDPKIASDAKLLGKLCKQFEKKYKTDQSWLENPDALRKALDDYEKLVAISSGPKPLMYFWYRLSLNSNDSKSRALLTKYHNEVIHNVNRIKFFELNLSKIPKDTYLKFIRDLKLSAYKQYLKRLFREAKYMLSEKEEQIISLFQISSHDKWVDLTEKLLTEEFVYSGGKKISLAEAEEKISESNLKTRRILYKNVNVIYKKISDVAEAEINSICLRKKVTDDLRKFARPQDETIISYHNTPLEIDMMTKTVTSAFKISHDFYNLKKRILGLPFLKYEDRSAAIGHIKWKANYHESSRIVQNALGKVSPEFENIFSQIAKSGRIDALPRIGKSGGAYCSSSITTPTMILLNFTPSMHSTMTLGHEIGHAIHTECSRKMRPLYASYTTSTAEVASTLFENFVFDELISGLSPYERVVARHNRINAQISTIFRQIACFNFEVDMHNAIREKGALSKKELSALMVKHMQSYLGPAFKITEDDGYHFVRWSHIRRFFYVYSYAYGAILSTVMYENLKNDSSYLHDINKFLSAGSSLDPNELFRSIGLNTERKEIWQNGVQKIEREIDILRSEAKKNHFI